MTMNTVLASIGLVLMGLILVVQIMAYFIMRTVFNQEYSESIKLSYTKKIAWLKANRSDFSAANVSRVESLIRFRRLEIAALVLLFSLFLIGIFFGWIKG